MLAPRLLLLAALAACTALFAWVGSASALNYVDNTSNDDYWAVHDAAIPGLDTGSIETTGGDTLQGYGGLRMQVLGAPEEPRLNKALMRGFGLTYDGVDTFTTHKAVKMGGVAITRELYIDRAESYARFYDTFTNTTSSPLTVNVAFGGQLGGKTNYGGPYYQSSVVDSSSGDAVADTDDAWVVVATGEPSQYGPSATVLGSPETLTKTGNFLQDPFNRDLETEGDEGNHYGYVNQLKLDPGETASLLHYVAISLSEVVDTPSGEEPPAAGTQIAAVEALAETLAATPDLSNLTTGELCTIANFDEAEIVAGRPGFSSGDCPTVLPDVPLPVDGEEEVTTSSPYDVVGKTVVELMADMEGGKTNAQQIMRAYLDRIAAYDQGPLGFHSFISINGDAMAEAKAADKARAAGSKLPLLGIPVAVKDIIDTEELKTTGGSLVFKNFQPEKDSFLVQRLRAAGAIVIGKANLSEFANSGHYSESAFGQVWNAFDPSVSSIGSSGGSATAVAASFAPVALGSQTGDSLWGPASGASLVSMRGTDGQTSAAGTMPLTYLQDYVGAFTRTVGDHALVLNAIAADNPADEAQALQTGWDGKRPSDWRTYLDSNALQGKTIGFYPTAFEDPFGTEDTTAKLQDQFKYFTSAGATVKEIADPPSGPSRSEFYSGDLGYTGWLKWIQGEPNSPYTDPEEILRSPLRLPTYRNTSPYTGSGAMSEEDLEGFVSYRKAYQQRLTEWMDEEGVDAVVFPGHLSYIHLNDSPPPSFGRRDPQSSGSGVPTMIIPAGTNSDGKPGNLQLEGRPFSDTELLAMAHDFELESNGHVETTYAPALRYDPDSVAEPVAVTPAPPAETVAPPGAQPPVESEVTPPVAAPVKAKVFFKKLKKIKKAGTAFIKVRVTGRGYLAAKSNQVRKVVRKPKSAQALWIPVRAKGRALATLNKKGRVKVKVKIKLVSPGGAKAYKTKTVVLVKR